LLEIVSSGAKQVCNLAKIFGLSGVFNLPRASIVLSGVAQYKRNGILAPLPNMPKTDIFLAVFFVPFAVDDWLIYLQAF
jgi:hypothetical protein